MSTVNLLRFHRKMILDYLRLERFQQAITACVKAGDVVLDLGSGTGVLAILAVRAGARIVYAIEATEIVEVARNIIRKNGAEDQIVFLEDLSSRVDVPEPADVLITETIGNFGLNEGILGWVMDARNRFLKPDAVVIPATIEMFAVPVEFPEAYFRDIDWPYVQFGIDFEPMRQFAVNDIYAERIRPENYLANPGSLGEIRLTEARSTAFSAQVGFEITRAGELHGLGGWFASRLCDGIEISNNPKNPPGSWKQAFMPFQSSVAVKPGDQLQARISCSNNGTVWRWQLKFDSTMPGASKGRTEAIHFDQSTFYGAPSMPSHLHRHAAGHMAELNLDGRILTFLLGLIDGKRTLEELSTLLVEEFPEQFTEPAEALERVRTLSADFGR